MRGKLLVLLMICIACNNDFFPEGLYDYQVERLLSGDDSKVWKQVLSSGDCQDSVKLVFTFISNTTDDSVLVQRLVSNEVCSGFDTTSLGNADASSFNDALLFTDSLNFANNAFWIIRSLTSDQLIIDQSTERILFLSN